MACPCRVRSVQCFIAQILRGQIRDLRPGQLRRDLYGCVVFAQGDTAARDEQIKRINDLQDYIAQQTTHITEFDESLVRRWIKQITIWEDHITVELKSGVSIDVDA